MYFSRLCVLFLFLFLSAESALAQCQIYYSSNSTGFNSGYDTGRVGQEPALSQSGDTGRPVTYRS